MTSHWQTRTGIGTRMGVCPQPQYTRSINTLKYGKPVVTTSKVLEVNSNTKLTCRSVQFLPYLVISVATSCEPNLVHSKYITEHLSVRHFEIKGCGQMKLKYTLWLPLTNVCKEKHFRTRTPCLLLSMGWFCYVLGLCGRHWHWKY